jgi:inorganic pyrophosphatase
MNISSTTNPPMVDIVIEIPRGGFAKVGSQGELDFISPLPCPFNYGSVPTHVGLEGDLLDALVLGPRLAVGTRLTLPAFGAVGLSDRGLYDDKLVYASHPPCVWQRRGTIAFFHLYAVGKRGLNLYRRRPGLTRCEGWGEAADAIGRASPRSADWQEPAVEFRAAPQGSKRLGIPKAIC